MRTITLLFSLIAISLQAQLQVLPNYPEGQEFYKGGYMKFYEDAHDFVKNNNIQPCENPDEVYLMKILVNPDGKVNYVQDPDVMGVKNNRCAFDFGKKILANLNDYVPAEVDGVKTPALTRIIFYPKELFADSNYIPLNSSLIDAEFPGGISNYRKKFISCFNTNGFNYSQSFRFVINFEVDTQGDIQNIYIDTSFDNEDFVKIRFEEIVNKMKREIKILDQLNDHREQEKENINQSERYKIYKSLLEKNIENIENTLNKL